LDIVIPHSLAILANQPLILCYSTTHCRYDALSVRLVDGKTGFNYLAMSDQKTLKVGTHSFPAWRSAVKRDSMKIGRQVRLLWYRARHFTGLPLPLNG